MTSFSLSLLQVLLPDNQSLLSADIPTTQQQTDQPTVLTLIQALLNDSSNHKTLENVFGKEVLNPESAHRLDQGDRDRWQGENQKWFTDTNGSRWAVQAVNLSEQSREWRVGEMQGDKDGELY